MIPFTNSYRPKAVLFVFLCIGKLLSAQSGGTTPAPAKETTGQKTTTKGQVPEPESSATSSIVLKQTQSVSAMNAAIDKQKATIQTQLGIATPPDSFFSSAWITPASIPIPHLIPSCSAMADADLATLVSENAKKQEVKPELIRAVIRRESASYPCAVSNRGALGLMQLMPEVADQFGVDALDAAQNVRAGTAYLKQLLTRYKGDVKLALAAYNAGPERVDTDHKVPDIPETLAYVDSILKDLTQTAVSHR
jgi:soluble lytic murein transglycosylase-like protein